MGHNGSIYATLNDMGTIRISESKITPYHNSWRFIYSKSSFFADCKYYTIRQFNGGLSITKHYFEIPKNANIVSKPRAKYEFYQFSTALDLPIGTFETDESNCDQMIVYY